jgi:hypothetical protein
MKFVIQSTFFNTFLFSSFVFFYYILIYFSFNKLLLYNHYINFFHTLAGSLFPLFKICLHISSLWFDFFMCVCVSIRKQKKKIVISKERKRVREIKFHILISCSITTWVNFSKKFCFSYVNHCLYWHTFLSRVWSKKQKELIPVLYIHWFFVHKKSM